MTEHPGVVFKDGPSGRRAALTFVPDIWEVAEVPRQIDEDLFQWAGEHGRRLVTENVKDSGPLLPGF